jgi:glucose-6-phosphate-specific signal transduction histidine kinase
MNVFENVPWDRVAGNLRDQADKMSGWQGAVVGAGLGVITTVAAMKAVSREVTIPILIAGAAMGLAYGAADKRLIQGN